MYFTFKKSNQLSYTKLQPQAKILKEQMIIGSTTFNFTLQTVYTAWARIERHMFIAEKKEISNIDSMLVKLQSIPLGLVFVWSAVGPTWPHGNTWVSGRKAL